jgi:uncharacterized protein YhjY with autotransporter beta-barrel domain/phospholipase/lecithinase/hemolysin
MLKSSLRRALACASLVTMAAVATPASAQQIDRIIVFGDSYADTGNALRLAGIDPLTTQVYTTGRFSGGTNYVDTLSNILQVPQFNFAIGGARTDNNNQSAGLPGLTTEVQLFNAGGGTLGFPVVNTTLTRNDLVAVSIGGNDARFYQQNGGTVAGAPAAAAIAVANTQQNLNVVMAHGTPTISFLAGNTALLPEVQVQSNPAQVAAVRQAYSDAYNSGVQSVLAGYAQQGSIVHYLDLTAVLNNVQANPTAFGITNGLVCPAFPNPTCVVDSSGYLFYGDLLHLTSDGFAILGQYIAVQLDAPLTLQAPSDLGLDTARQWGRTLSSRGDLYGRGVVPDGLRFYVVGDAFSRNVPRSDENNDFDIRGTGASVGAEYGMAGGVIGIAGNYTRPRAEFGNESARVSGRTWQIGAYGSIDMNGLFGQAYLGYGHDRNRIRRAGVVDGMSASASGNHWSAGAKGGYLMSFLGMQAGPVVALDYARAKVDGYTESGDPALTLIVGSQSLKALTGQAGIEARADVSGFHPFVDLTAEHEFNGDHRLITFAQTSAPVIVNSWSVTRDKETYGRIAGGASADIGSGISIDAYGTTTLGRDHGQELGGQLGVKARF